MAKKPATKTVDFISKIFAGSDTPANVKGAIAQIEAMSNPEAEYVELLAELKEKLNMAKKPAKTTATEKTEGEKQSIVSTDFLQKYGKDRCNGDELSLKFKEYIANHKEGIVGALVAVAKANGLDISKYDHLNVGQKRMNVGNLLRGKIKRGEAVKIGGWSVKADPEKAKAAAAKKKEQADKLKKLANSKTKKTAAKKPAAKAPAKKAPAKKAAAKPAAKKAPAKKAAAKKPAATETAAE